MIAWIKARYEYYKQFWHDLTTPLADQILEIRIKEIRERKSWETKGATHEQAKKERNGGR